MIVPINNSIRQYFNTYLQVLNPFFNLTRIEQDVLSAYLLLHYTNRTNPEIDTLLFKTDTRKHLRKTLKLSEASFNNILHSLKKKKMIQDNKFSTLLTNGYPKDNSQTITFKFKINE